MWAVQYHRYGGPSVLRRERVPRPVLRPGEVLLETVAGGVSLIDLLYRSGRVRLHGAGFPKQPGFDALGIVRESRVAGIRPGAWAWTVLGLEPARRRGTAVELLAVDADRLGVFPDGFVPDPAAGALPLGALTALKGLRDGLRVAAGQRVLVVGAGGAVGTAAIQLARGLDAEVDAVCGPRGRGVCLALGAREAFDHTGSTRRLRNGGGYDAVLVAAGRAADWLGALRPRGRLAITRADRWLRTLPHALIRRRWIGSVAAGHGAADLTWLAGEVAAGRLAPVVDRAYRVDELARAHAEHGRGGTAGARLVHYRQD